METNRKATVIKLVVLIVWCCGAVMVMAALLDATLDVPTPDEAGQGRQDEPDTRTALHVESWSWYDGIHTVVQFRIAGSSVPKKKLRYIWNLGNGMKTEGTEVYGVYLDGGTVQVQVDALDTQGRSEAFGSVLIEPFKSPFPVLYSTAGPRVSGSRGSSELYLNASAPGALFAIEGTLLSWKGEGKFAAHLEDKGRSGVYHIYQSLKPGYCIIKSDSGHSYHIFTSPLPTIHVDRPDMDWYLTQWNTATLSNCGPTVTAMSVQWARGLPVDVVAVRNMMGWEGDGAVSFSDMQHVLDYYGVAWKPVMLGGIQDIFAVLDRGHLLAVSYDMAGISLAPDPAHNLLGQHYADKGGHYLALKGYSLDRKYLVVYDPIPSDWGYNRLRYGDGETMLGRNRYFAAPELWKALRSRHSLEIMP